MDYSILSYQEESGIGILTISRPEVLNALNSKFFLELNHFIGTVNLKQTLKVLLITGDGKSFVAGADIAEMQQMTVNEAYIFSRTGQETFNSLESLEIPVIAVVNGYAIGGGCELALACDFRIAGSNARFGFPEVGLGLIPGYGGTQRLSRLVGTGDALYLVLSGQLIDSAEALRIGLVQKIVEPDNLLIEAKSIAAKIAEKSPAAVKAARNVVRKGLDILIKEGFELESSTFSTMFEKDGPEGMKAFLEKRKPDWNLPENRSKSKTK